MQERTVAPSLLEIAEAPAAHIVPKHPGVVERDGYVFVPFRPDIGAAQLLRLAPEALPAARDDVRALARDRGLAAVGWWTSALSQPRDLGSLLGLELDETLAALAITSTPPAGAEVEVREIATLADYAAAQDIDATVHGWPRADAEQHARQWERARELFLLWLALENGRPVGMARCAVSAHALMLTGGSVLPEFRGRGIYRALVAARWQAAVARGLPALVTVANHQSRPILERLGFDRLGEVEVWVDRF